jgi:putative peptide zinc metalloprotease protein
MDAGPDEKTAAMPAEAVGDDEASPSMLASANGGTPRLADGVQLLGQYEGSGFKDPPYIVRRADGQMVQLPPLLYLVAEGMDGEHGFAEIAERVSERLGRGVGEQDVSYLAEKKLRPLGLLAADDGSNPELKEPDLLLGLKLRAAIIPASAVRAVATIFHPLFVTLVVLAVLGGLLVLDTWLFFGHGMAQSVRQTLYQPVLLLMIFGLVVVSAAFHEIGHATACKYGGAQPGVMGAGIYIVWPAFYTDVTDAYRLGKGGRLRTDLGGVYFNCVFILATAGVYFWTGFEPLLVLIFVQHLEIIRQLLPILRFDGYYVLSDLTGVPDLFSRIKPILAGLVPWKKTDERARELKAWARAVVTVWVLMILPLLAFNLVMIVIHAPRIAATAMDSLGAHYQRVSEAFGAGKPAAGAAGILQMATLALPMAGMTFTMGRLGRRLSSSLWRKSDGKPAARMGATLLIIGAAAFLVMAWWPDSDYRPIRPGERWTVQEGVEALTLTAAGRAAFPADAEQQTSQQGASARQPGSSPTPTPTVPAVQATRSPDPTPSPTLSPSPGASVSPSPSPSPSLSPSPSPSPTTTP